MMNKLVYIYVPNEFVIGQVVFKSFTKRLAVAMVNKTVVIFPRQSPVLASYRVSSTICFVNSPGHQPPGSVTQHSYWACHGSYAGGKTFMDANCPTNTAKMAIDKLNVRSQVD
jgi:hypothetical protein